MTGSVATDHLMTFPGKFVDALLPEQLNSLSVSFLVDDLQVRRGGVGANIAFGLGSLGLSPLLLASVGADFEDYRAWLEARGVDTSAVLVSTTQHTARFTCTTDTDQNQISSFYPGAMSQARDLALGDVIDRIGDVDLVLVGPDDPVAMSNYTQECRRRGLAFAADPSQQLTSLESAEVSSLIDGAAILFSNEYEAALIRQKTGWTDEQILGRVDTRVTTQAAAGATVTRSGADPIHVRVPREDLVADPTGVGDGFRAGYLAGTAWRLGSERAAQIGCTLATYVVETVGTQEYSFTPDAFVRRLADTYGDTAAAEVRRALSSALSH